MTDTLFQTLDLLGGNSSTWDLYRETFNTTGPKSLFMIPFVSDITPEDVEKSVRLVEFYLGSSDNITLDNAQALIDMFTDSGKIFLRFQLLINDKVTNRPTYYQYDIYDIFYSLHIFI